MRWGNLLYDNPQPDDGPGQLPLFGLDSVARTFDTPEFKGMTFYEVRAKSIINRVPGESRVPFSWTINPYRGCGHACVYCLAGDTRILLADGTTRPLAFLEVGDAVIGTVPGGRRRQTVVTHVLGHWSTTKRAYRIRVDDGRQLVASGDHRFLTNRGWAQVAEDLAPDPDTDTGSDPGTDTGGELDDGVGGAAGRFDRPRLLAEGSILLGSDITGRTPAADLVGRPVTPSAGGVVMGIEPLGPERALFDISTGTGDFVANGLVSHNCFARNTHEYLDLDSGADFDRKVIVKVNAAELLHRELRKASWSGEAIAMGTNVDCYQRAEGRYQLMRGILTALRDARNPFSILTKGTLVLRDLDLLHEAAEVTDVSLSVSVGSVDRELWRSVEPGTPSPQARLGICRRLADEGLSCSVLMAPILPYLSDSPRQLDETVRAIAEAGARRITPILLHLRPGAREWYARWLGQEHPALVPRYRELYGNRSYAPKAYQHRIAEQVGRLARRYGLAA